MTTATRPLPEHGRVSRHKHHGCKCLPCADAWRDYQANRRRQKAYGRWQPLVDAEPVRQHVRALMAAGIGIRRIAQLAEVSQPALARLLYGKDRRTPTQQMFRATAAKVLAVQATLDAYADGAAIDATGTRRRIQALTYIGWTSKAIAAEVGVHPPQIGHLLRTSRVAARMARQVAAAYERLWCQDPARHGIAAQPTARARNRAAAKGWAGPLAWDETTIDDPQARPVRGDRTGSGGVDQAAVIRALEGERIDLSPMERTAAVELGVRRGMSREDIARELGMELDAVRRSWERIKARRRAAGQHVPDEPSETLNQGEPGQAVA